MKHAPPTLIDRLYRESFRNEPVPGWLNNAAMRERFVKARRFVLDEGMSAFLADLANVSFAGKLYNKKLAQRLAENLRVSARAPHAVIWVEFDLRAEMRRASEITGNDIKPFHDTPYREGWLIEQHPSLDYAVRLHLFSDMHGSPGVDGHDAWTFPVCYGWTVNDQPLPWNTQATAEGAVSAPSEVFAGLRGYRCDKVNIVDSELIPDAMRYEGKRRKMVLDLLMQWTGLMRRVWGFLATINDIPVLATEVRSAHGFLGKGQIRKYLTHTTLTLHVPQKTDTRKVARKAMALARRRGHDVRGHWRRDWRQLGVSTCQHLFAENQRCTNCGAHRIWIAEHHRGDDSIGRVIHDYAVKHETEVSQ